MSDVLNFLGRTACYVRQLLIFVSRFLFPVWDRKDAQTTFSKLMLVKWPPITFCESFPAGLSLFETFLLGVWMNFANVSYKEHTLIFYWRGVVAGVAGVALAVDLGIDWIYCWNWFLALFIPLKISKYGFTIIWTSSKDKNFPKIWRMWLKNWVSYAHFNFELLKAVTALIFEPHSWNFNQICIFL